MSTHPAQPTDRPRKPLRAALLAGVAAVALAACTDDPPPIPGDALDPAATSAAARARVAEFSATVVQPPHPRDRDEAPQLAAMRATLVEAGLIRIDADGAVTMTDAGIATAWRVRASEASWVSGSARIAHLSAYRLVDTHNLDSRVCCGLAYDASVGTDAIGAASPPIVVPGLALNLWNDRSPPTVQRWFDTDGRLLVAQDELAAALTQSLQTLADAPPVAGVREWDDAATRSCPNAAEIDTLRRTVRRTLFAIPAQRVADANDALTLDADTTSRLLAGEFDTTFDQDERFFVLSPASAPIRALSKAFEQCARTPGIDAKMAAWATLWAHDVAMKWGTVSRPRQPPLADRTATTTALLEKLARLRDRLGSNGAQRLAVIRALEQSGFEDVATYARWVHWDAAGAATPSSLQDYFLTFDDES